MNEIKTTTRAQREDGRQRLADGLLIFGLTCLGIALILSVFAT